MTRNPHPLTEARAAELWEAHIPERKTHYLGWQSFPEPSRRCFTTILRAAYDAGREDALDRSDLLAGPAPLDPHHDPRPWQDCTVKDIRKGDLVGSQAEDILYVGVAHRQDDEGDWWTKDGYLLTNGTLWTLRRIPAHTPPAEVVELPTEHPAHITDVETSVGDTCAYMALDRDGDWVGVDQDGELRDCLPVMLAAFTLPDGTRVRRDEDHPDGTPRFVKETHDDRP